MASAVLFSEQLLEQASFLIGLNRRRTNQVDLRRGTSAAYYALFHLLADEAGDEFFGKSKSRRALRAAVARAFDHGALRSFCERFSAASFPLSLPSPLRPCLASVSADLKTVAKNLVLLQELRHRADYDRLNPLSEIEASESLLLSQRAMEAWMRVRGEPEAAAFLVAVVTWKSLAAR